MNKPHGVIRGKKQNDERKFFQRGDQQPQKLFAPAWHQPDSPAHGNEQGDGVQVFFSQENPKQHGKGNCGSGPEGNSGGFLVYWQAEIGNRKTL